MDDIEKLKIENEELRKRNENKSDIISITAHQLRTSLSALKWILKMLTDQEVGKLTSEQNELVEKAITSNDRMLALVNDLLTLNHTDNASIIYNFKKVDLVNLVEQTLFEFYGETNNKGIELIFLAPEVSIPSTNCDEEMMRVVIQNLVENAIKYSNNQGKIFVSLKQRDNEILILVHNVGIGIKEEDRDKIFEKFYRAENAKEKDPVGSGLGLYTTKNIVEKHKGKIWFESIPGSDTTFFVSLPIN